MTRFVERQASPELTLMTEFSAPKRSTVMLHQLKAVYSEALPLFLVSIICAGLVSLLLLNEIQNQATGNKHTTVILWLTSTVLVSLLQIGLILAFKRISKKPFSPTLWHNLFLAGTLINGIHWAVAALVLQSGSLGVVELVAAAAVGSTLVYAATVFTMNLKAFFCFATPPLAGLLIHTLLWVNSYGYPYLFINIMFAGFLSYSALHHYKNRKRALVKSLENASLIQYLDNARCVAEALNEQLSNEVFSREATENELKAAHKTLEHRVKKRTLDLTEANEKLSQQVTLRKNISDALVKSQTRLSQAIEASQLGLWDWDLTKGTVYQSTFHDAFKQRELTTVDFIANLKRVIHPHDYQLAKAALTQYLKRESDSYSVQYRINTQKEGWLWIEDCGKTVKVDNDGSPLRILGTRRNINSEKKRDEQVRLAKSVFDHTSEGVFVLDTDLRFISVNPAFQTITGYDKEELEGHVFFNLSSTPKKHQVFKQAQESLNSEDHWQAEFFEKRKNGNYFPAWVQINTIRHESGAVNYYAGLMSDISVRKEADEKLKYLLNYDDLTGLANRSLFRDRLHNAVEKTRQDNTRFYLIIIDIDRFKQINDSLGHEAGDALLKEVAQRIATSIDKADTIARLASDEFAVIIECNQDDTIEELASSQSDLLLDSLSAPYFIQQNELLISCSVGISLLPDYAQELKTLLQQATIATQHAKYLGGNNTQFYRDELQSLSQDRMIIEKELRKAIKNDELEVFYQPKMNVHNQRIESAEALVRWRHSSKGLISPSEFVHIAEDSGLIADIGHYVLLKACQQSKQWADDGIGDIKVCVNISAHQLRHTNLVNTISNVLKNTGLNAQQLELEITESSIMENLNAATELLKDLCSMGISIALDDFGTGYSSLSYLKLFPVDSLKIDRSFIQDIETTPEDAAIAKAIIMLGHSLKLKVTAEGIENKAQYTLLEKLGCNEIQGYYIAKPLPVNNMTSMLIEKNVKIPKPI